MSQPNVDIIVIEPDVGGNIIYAPVAPPVKGGQAGAQLALKAQIRNNEAQPLELTRVVVHFLHEPGGNIAVPAVYDVNDNSVDTVFAGNNVIPAGATRFIPIQKRANNKTLNIKLIAPPAPAVNVDFTFAGFNEEVTVFRHLVPHQSANGTGANGYHFPAKAGDLNKGEVWSGATSGIGSHHSTDERFAYDMGVRRFDPSTGKWTAHKPGMDGSNNADFLCFGKPIYAMADGVVEALQRDRIDNPIGNPDNNTAANFVRIRHGDEVAHYFHFQQGTVDPNLNPGDLVHKGQFLGRCGNSGHSDKPHLHMDVRSASGHHLRPLPFHDTFVVDRAQLLPDDLSGPWLLLDGQTLPFGKAVPPTPDVKTAIWPVPSLPKSVAQLGKNSEQAGQITVVAVAALGPERVVTAVQATESTRLRLIVWDISANGQQISRLGGSGSQAGPADVMALVALDTSRVVTAVRTQEGRLKLIVWNISGDGQMVTRLGDSENQPETTNVIAATALGFGRLATAIRTASGRLRIILWQVDTAGQVSRLGDSADQAGEVDLISLVSDGAHRLLTAVKGTVSGRLRLIVWDLSTDGQTITRLGDSGNQANDVELISAVTLATGRVVTAVKASANGRLRLIAWEIAADGQTVTRLADSGTLAGTIDLLSATHLGAGRMITAVKARGSDKLKLILWYITTDGQDVARLGDSGDQGGTPEFISATTLAADRIITATRGAAEGRLNVKSWGVND